MSKKSTCNIRFGKPPRRYFITFVTPEHRDCWNRLFAGAFLHALVNTILDMAWLKDVNVDYLPCNPRFEHARKH